MSEYIQYILATDDPGEKRRMHVSRKGKQPGQHRGSSGWQSVDTSGGQKKGMRRWREAVAKTNDSMCGILAKFPESPFQGELSKCQSPNC
jgi:hypothetical protein